MLNKRAFTLLELILVVIIIGILAGMGMTNYSKMVEKSRIAEAKTILGQIRTLQEGYKLEYNTRTTDWSKLGLSGLSTVVTCPEVAYYYWYSIADKTKAVATRCETAGKSPGYTPTYAITLNYDAGTFEATGP